MPSNNNNKTESETNKEYIELDSKHVYGFKLVAIKYFLSRNVFTC